MRSVMLQINEYDDDDDTCLATEARSDPIEFICAIQKTLMYVYVCTIDSLK